MAGNSTEPGQSVTSRVAAVLLTFTDGNVYSLTEIARLTGLPVSTAHRLAVELAATDLLERDASGRYRVARSLSRLGAADWREPTLAERGPCVLDDLSEATQRVARLGVLAGTTVRYIEKRPHRPVTDFDAGARLPAHATAIGKALLAFSPTRITDGLIAKGLTRFTKNTITSPDLFRHNLTSIRRIGMAVSMEELQNGNGAVAMPVFSGNRAIAALELQVEDLRTEPGTLTAALAMACGSLARELKAALPPEVLVGRLLKSTPSEAVPTETVEAKKVGAA